MKNSNSLLYSILFLTIIFSSNLYAQPAGDIEKSGVTPGNSTIRGRVLDEMTTEPLPYSNVVLYNQTDSTLITGAIAQDDGHFILSKVPAGNFYLEIKFIGYNKKVLSNIQLKTGNETIDLGNVKIEPASQELQEIQITADRPTVEYLMDRKVVHVSENINSTGSSVARALENVPSITVDVEGTVSLRGSTNYTVLIDGKPSPLKGSDALQQIPASAVENVEIITNPSAKYDPDGLAGIVNIVTKKQALNGISGIVNTSVGTGDKYRGDGLLTYKSDKISIFAGADFNDETRSGSLKRTSITTLSDTTNYRTSDGGGSFGHNGYTFKTGITYNLNDKNSISLEGNVGQHGGNRSISDNFYEYNVPSTGDLYYTSQSNGNRSEDFYGITLNYQKIFENVQHQLTSYLYYSGEQGGNQDNQSQWYTTPDGVISDSDPFKIRTIEDSKSKELRYQLDFTKPLGEKGKLETGYQFRYDWENETYTFLQYDNASGDWIDNPENNNNMIFRRSINAAFATLSNEWLGFGYMLGLRTEYTNRTIEHLLSDQPAVIDRLDLFPTLHLSKEIGKQDQALLSYSRRINRPRGWDLDPFPGYMDSKNVRIGNPQLSPEYVDSYELSYQKGLGKSFISLETYYRLTHDKMTRILKLQEDGTRVHTIENMDQESSAGAELMLNFIVTKWYGFSASTNLYHYQLIGNGTDQEMTASSNNFDFRMDNNFKLTKTTQLQIQGFYQGPSVTAQGSRQEFFMTNAAVKQDFFNQKLTATLRVQDIFKTGSFHFTSEGEGFLDEYNFSRESQVFNLSLSFRINNYKKQERSQTSNGSEMDTNFGY